MNKPISPLEKQALIDKRQKLFSLLRGGESTPSATPVPSSASASTSGSTSGPVTMTVPRQSVQAFLAQRQAEEVQDMLRKFANPNADRWSLL